MQWLRSSCASARASLRLLRRLRLRCLRLLKLCHRNARPRNVIINAYMLLVYALDANLLEDQSIRLTQIKHVETNNLEVDQQRLYMKA